MNLKLILHEICKIKMSKEVEKSNLKVMELENELKQKQKKLEEVQSEMLKYTSKIGKIIEDQSFLEENITNRNIDSNDNLFEKKTYGFEIIPFETICTFLILFALTMFNWMKQNDEARKNADVYDNVTNGLQTTYKQKLLPLEKEYQYHDFHSPQLDDPDFDARPMVMLVGQYSTGKTTFIRYLLEQDFPGIRIGPEPTTDR